MNVKIFQSELFLYQLHVKINEEKAVQNYLRYLHE